MSTRATLGKARQFIRLALEKALLFYAEDPDPAVAKYRALVEDPSSHRNYLIL